METREQQALRLFNSACECIENEKYKSKCFELFNLAIEDINKENYLDTYYHLKQAATIGHTDSQYFLSIWYLFGLDCIGLKQDISKAIYYLVKSAHNFNYDSRKLLTALGINIKKLQLKEKNIDSVIESTIREKESEIKNIIETHKYDILKNIKNPYIVQQIMKEKQITPEKPTLLEQHNISIQHDREKRAKYKPKLKHNKKQIGTLSSLIELTKLIKENSQLKGENVKLKMENMSLVNINETLEQEVKETKKEWQNMCDMLMSIVTQQQNPQQTQEELLQNAQINTNVIPQNEYIQPTNLNQQIPNREVIQTQQIQPITQQNIYNIYQNQNNGQIIDYGYLQQQNTLNTNINYQEQFNNLNDVVNYTNQNYQNHFEQFNGNLYP